MGGFSSLDESADFAIIEFRLGGCEIIGNLNKLDDMFNAAKLQYFRGLDKFHFNKLH